MDTGAISSVCSQALIDGVKGRTRGGKKGVDGQLVL